MLFPAHGPPIADHATLIVERLAEDGPAHAARARWHRTEPKSALDVGRELLRGRVADSWEMMADLVGRLDLLVAEGAPSRAWAKMAPGHFKSTERRS